MSHCRMNKTSVLHVHTYTHKYLCAKSMYTHASPHIYLFVQSPSLVTDVTLASHTQIPSLHSCRWQASGLCHCHHCSPWQATSVCDECKSCISADSSRGPATAGTRCHSSSCPQTDSSPLFLVPLPFTNCLAAFSLTPSPLLVCRDSGE